MAAPRVIACRWDWCPSSFTTIEALETHVKHAHIWPMKPMRKADIADMRRMDLQCLHSSFSDSSIISRGAITGVSRNKTPPPAAPPTSTTKKRSENEPFNTFTQLSSPLQTDSPQKLPVSPAFEGLIGHDLSAAVELSERANARKKGHRLRFSHSLSPTHRPLSDSSGSSQEVVEQQLTQEDDGGSQLRPPPLSEPQVEDEADPELRWPTDDESDVIVAEGTQISPHVPKENHHHRGNNPDSARGQNFRYGSLNVPLGVNCAGPSASPGSQGESQPLVLQSQAPCSSQAMGWS